MKQKLITQTFNSGVLNIFDVGNIAAKGDKPKEGLSLKFGSIPYEERIVGMSRFWTAKQEQSTISQVLRIPRFTGVSDKQKVIPLDGEQYDIVQIQLINDVEPPSVDLSLQLRSVKYGIKGY